jgi:hypothetical protein
LPSSECGPKKQVAITGGSWSDIGKAALIGGATGAVTAAIGAGVLHGLGSDVSSFLGGGNIADFAGRAVHAAAEGVVGGGLSEATGGNFKDGFIGAAAGTMLSPVSGYVNENLGFGKAGTGNGWQLLGRTATSAAVGGTVAVIGGGKFGNGAATAAFMHLVNAEATGAIRSSVESNLLNDAFNKLPCDVRDLMHEKGVKLIVVENSVVEWFTNLKGVQPRGWPADKTWDTVAGAYDPNSRTVVVARSGMYATGSFDTALHEIGHAYDHAAGYLSKSEAFVGAYNADKGTIKNPYYLQAGDAGLSETYAESFAAYHGANGKYRRSHPNLWGYHSGQPVTQAPRRSFWSRIFGRNR